MRACLKKKTVLALNEKQKEKNIHKPTAPLLKIKKKKKPYPCALHENFFFYLFRRYEYFRTFIVSPFEQKAQLNVGNFTFKLKILEIFLLEFKVKFNASLIG